MFRAGLFLLLSPFASGCVAGKECNNGEAGMGPCFAGVQDEIGNGYMMLHSSFGPRGRQLAVERALAYCELPLNTDPSVVEFKDAISYSDLSLPNQQGPVMIPEVIDIEDYYFRCPEPGKDTQ